MRHLTAKKNQPKSSAAAVIRALAATLLIAPTVLVQAQTPTPERALEPSLPYVVKASDKLIRLSRDLLVTGHTWNDVARYNQLKDPNAGVPASALATTCVSAWSRASTAV